MTLAERYMYDVPVGYASDSAFTGILLFELHEEDKHDHHDFVVCNEINGKRTNFKGKQCSMMNMMDMYLSVDASGI